MLVAGVFALGRKGQEEVGGNVLGIGAMGDRAAQAVGFQDRKDEFLGGSRISGGLEHDELPALQVRLNGAGGLLDIGKVGLAPLVERRGHADHHGVHLRQPGEISGRREVLGANVLLDLGPGMCPI